MSKKGKPFWVSLKWNHFLSLSLFRFSCGISPSTFSCAFKIIIKAIKTWVVCRAFTKYAFYGDHVCNFRRLCVHKCMQVTCLFWRNVLLHNKIFSWIIFTGERERETCKYVIQTGKRGKKLLPKYSGKWKWRWWKWFLSFSLE